MMNFAGGINSIVKVISFWRYHKWTIFAELLLLVISFLLGALLFAIYYIPRHNQRITECVQMETVVKKEIADYDRKLTNLQDTFRAAGAL